MIDLDEYDRILLAFSGGKDSLASLFHVLDQGVPRSKIELWHHEIDGREGSSLMDWPITPSYCRAVAAAFSIPIYYSWKIGGFEGEMLRENALTAPTAFEVPDGSTVQTGGTRGKLNTRMKFPQVSADLSVRWCSAYLKIDVCATAIRNQPRFNNSRTLIVSGERAEESPARSKYLVFEPDRSDNRSGKKRRHVDRWRPVHAWKEDKVWEIIAKYKVAPHPAYLLGWGRVSCMKCIFGSAHQWASVFKIDSDGFLDIYRYEQEFGVTINRDKSILELVKNGVAYTMKKSDICLALSKTYYRPIILDDWQLPAGAFGESCGPT